MLFSNAAVATFIDDNFEPAWQSVREVPIVHIDFGDSTAVTRTLHGNIATYVCTSDGKVLDILPGAYDPVTYLAQLQQLSLLGGQIVEADQPLAQMRKYHANRLVQLDEGARAITLPTRQEQIPKQQPPQIADFSKVAIIERPVEVVLAPAARPHQTAGSHNTLLTSLAQDTSYNEFHRRRKIHRRLAQADWTVPESLTKWLYREVLDTDLDDPYLGLKDLLTGEYPFAEDDR